MKKIVTLIILALSINVSYAQKLKSIDTLNLNETSPAALKQSFKNGFDAKVLILKDGSIIQKGSDLIVGNPSNPVNVNHKIYNGVKVGRTTIDFSLLMIGRYSIMGALSAIYFGNDFSQTEIVVERIRIYRTKKTITALVDFTNKDGTNTGFGKYGNILNLEKAILLGEIINPNAAMTRIEAIAKLKESKDLLDLEMMTQEEYDKIKNKLAPIIKGEK